MRIIKGRLNIGSAINFAHDLNRIKSSERTAWDYEEFQKIENIDL